MPKPISEIRPCPFCGEMPELSTKPCYYYQCVKSGCEGQEVSWNNTKEEALKSWNTRPIEDALRAEIVALKSQAIVWHKYPDECPNFDVMCLVMFDDGEPIVTTYDGFSWFDIEKNWLDRITHWAYLPAPPEEEK